MLSRPVVVVHWKVGWRHLDVVVFGLAVVFVWFLCLKSAENIIRMSEWVSEWLLLRQHSNFSAISWREQVNFLWEDDEFLFILEHTKLDFYSASSLKQQSIGNYVTPLWHIFLIPSQPVFVFSFKLYPQCRSNKYQFQSPISSDRGSHPRSTKHEASTLTITSPRMELLMWAK